jgi:hypothetical protein
VTLLDAPDDLSLVPPRRLGSLVAQTRIEQRLTVEQVAARSGGRLSAYDMKLLEAGRLAVEDTDVELLAELLGLPLGRMVPRRTELVIDRMEGRVIAGDSVGRFVPMATPVEVARRYLALVRALRGEQGNPDPTTMALRANDIAVLADAVGYSDAEMRSLLNEVLAADAAAIGMMSVRSRQRPLMPGLGLLVAYTSSGGLVLVSAATAVVGSGAPTPRVLPSGAIVRPLAPRAPGD